MKTNHRPGHNSVTQRSPTEVRFDNEPRPGRTFEMQRAEGSHIKVQLTLSGGRVRLTPSRSGQFTSVLRVGTGHFACTVTPAKPIAPGGDAVHCYVSFDQPEAARPHFPTGTAFEVWEQGRKGYGMVLATFSS